ncbi:MAG TPA: hypothetical protein PK185_09510 [Cyclobacteriaceae bacterium]|nr:hypothetical protein [Cyclobacteriaceae bacterium]HRK54143.1 hypothetical protein [Cyclobacteriaceae bacterium]
MKKLVFVMSLASALIFSGCDNENTVNPTVTLGSATITGTVYAELDNNNAVSEKAPSGTKVYVIVNTKDFVLNPTGGTYAKKYYEGTIDANGKYSITIETGNKTMTVTVVPADFTASVLVGPSTSEIQNFIGNNASDNVDVFANGTFILDLTY